MGSLRTAMPTGLASRGVVLTSPPNSLFPPPAPSSARRIEEMMQKKKREIYGQVYHIREQEFIPEVSKAPEDTYVVLHLFAPTSDQTTPGGQREREERKTAAAAM